MHMQRACRVCAVHMLCVPCVCSVPAVYVVYLHRQHDLVSTAILTMATPATALLTMRGGYLHSQRDLVRVEVTVDGVDGGGEAREDPGIG